ncbi:MAG: hypothetical protein ABSG49_06995 [Methanoregula sp.]|jgi:hypothetical protein|uniref:hypothetical protein n=1 Tax=Methanoregula sp. TaxID=2052170 RepID=UPI003C210EB2
MDATLITEIGSFCMGFIVMWIGFYFFNRSTTFDAKEFGEFIAVFFGGTIIQIYTTQLADPTKFIFWIYPIGLVMGMFAYHFISSGKITIKSTVSNTGTTIIPMLILAIIGFGAILAGLYLGGILTNIYDTAGLLCIVVGIIVIAMAAKYLRLYIDFT